MTTSKMSFDNSSSVERGWQRELQRRERRAQLEGKDVSTINQYLFTDPIKEKVDDDALGARVKRTLGPFHQVRDAINTNPKNLIGVPRQPPTPVKTQAPRGTHFFTEPPKTIKTPYHNGHGQYNRRPPPSKEDAGPSAIKPHSSTNVEFPKSSASSSRPMPQPVHSSAATTSNSVTAVASQGPPLLPPAMPLPVTLGPSCHQERCPPSQVAGPKYPPATASSANQRPSNGVVHNGQLKSGSSGNPRPSGSKPNLKLNLDNQTNTNSILDNILKEMIAPSPLTAIPNLRKDVTKFPFPSVGNNQLKGNAAPSAATPTVSQQDRSSFRLPQPNNKPRPTSGDMLDLDVDMELSEDSDDETNPESQKTSTTPKCIRPSEQAVLPNSPSPLVIMSQMSESSSSDSSDSSSEYDSEDNSNKSQSHSDASESESRPESPKPDADWNLDRFIQNTPAMPLGLPDPIPVPDQESQSFVIGYFPSDKGLGCEQSMRLVEDDFCSVPDLIKDFSKEDIKNLMPSPAPPPLESIVDPPQEDEVFSKVIEDVQPLSQSLSPIPSTPINKKKSLAPASRPSTPSTPSVMPVPQPSTKVKVDNKLNLNEINKVLGKNGFSKASLDDLLPITKPKDSTLSKPEKTHESSDSSHKVDHGGHKENESLSLKATSSKPRKSVSSSISKKPSSEKKSSSKRKSKVSNEAVPDKLIAESVSKRSVSPATPKGTQSPAPAKAVLLPPSRQNSSGSCSSKKEHGSAKALTSSSHVTKSLPPSTPPLLPSSTSTAKVSEKGIGSNLTVKKDGSNRRKSPKNQRLKFKSREILESDDSDSDNEIDVVGTPSPLKSANGTNVSLKGHAKQSLLSSASVESITETINAVSAGAGIVRKACHSPSHRSRTHKSNPSKDRNVVDVAVTQTNRKTTSMSSPVEELTAKAIHKKEFDSNHAVPQLPPLVYKDGIPSLMVKLDLSLLDRVPQNHPSEPRSKKESMGKTETRTPSKVSKPKEVGKSEHKRPLPSAAKEAEVTPKGKVKSPPVEPSKTPKEVAEKKAVAVKKETARSSTPETKSIKRPRDESDSMQSEKKKVKLSKDPVSISSSLSSYSSSMPKKESSQTKPPNGKVKKEHKEKDVSAASSTSSVKVPKSEPKNESSAASKSSKCKGESPFPDKKKSNSSPILKDEKRSKTPKESSEKKEKPNIQREKDTHLPVKSQPKIKVEAERCRSVEKESNKPKSPSRSRSNSFSKTQNVQRSSESVTGPSQNSCNLIQRPKDPKHRSKEQDSCREQDMKRRKHDSMPPSQTSSTEGPNNNSSNIERNTNHDRIPPIGDITAEPKVAGLHSIDWAALLEKINVEMQPRPHRNNVYYMKVATQLKHDADKEPDKTLQAMLYLRSVAYFAMTGSAMMREQISDAAIFKMYQKTTGLINDNLNPTRYVLCKFRVNQNATFTKNADRKIAVLSLWCLSILYLHMFRMRKNEVMDNSKLLMDYRKSQAGQTLHQLMVSPHQPSPSNTSAAQVMLWNNNKSTGAPSPLSPLPSPAGSVGSVESVSSGYSSSEIGHQKPTQQQHVVSVPLLIHSTMQKQLDHFCYLSSCHDLWEQAVSLITRGIIQDFFLSLDKACGRLTLHSSLDDLTKYVMLALHCIDVNT